MTDNQLKDKIVLITGASSGIGEEMANAFAKAGASVILIARNSDKLTQLASSITKNGGIAFTYPLDISDFKEVIEQTNLIKKEIGIPDIIINNAGSGIWKHTEDTERNLYVYGCTLFRCFLYNQSLFARNVATQNRPYCIHDFIRRIYFIFGRHGIHCSLQSHDWFSRSPIGRFIQNWN